MMKLLLDFSNRKVTENGYYDLREDWDLVESSLAKQYGIRIRTLSDMPWTEFSVLVSGLMPDTPLGQIVSIRSENDPEILKRFNSNQKQIRNDWLLKQANKQLDVENKDNYDKAMEALDKMFAQMFGGKEVK